MATGHYDYRRWARADLIDYGIWAGRRDQVVRAAAAAGISELDIHRLTAISHSTINRIIASQARVLTISSSDC
jgi:hypothetical protein